MLLASIFCKLSNAALRACVRPRIGAHQVQQLRDMLASGVHVDARDGGGYTALVREYASLSGLRLLQAGGWLRGEFATLASGIGAVTRDRWVPCSSGGSSTTRRKSCASY